MLCLQASRPLAAEMPRFQVHTIAEPAGRNFGQTSAVDVDRDGDVDFISGTQRGVVRWFENPGNSAIASRWPTHLIGNGAKTDVAGVAMDVDGDGWPDQVSGGTWFRNPGGDSKEEPPGKAIRQPWESYQNGALPAHDNLAHDINGDGKLDLVALLDEVGLHWYEIPEDPTNDWIEHVVIGVTDPQVHGGVAVGDIDGDGDVDMTRVDRWMENADGNGTVWIERRVFDFGKIGPWGLQTRAELVDIDRDGDLDLIQAEGDVYDGRVALFVNRSGDGKVWEKRLLRAEGHHQDFHSMNVADFDGDGDLDVFSGGGPLTQGDFVWFIWENVDGRGREWTEHTVQTGYSTHESVAVDVDGDNDIDLLTKPWRGNRHLFVENQLNEN